ncbi:hypothetical protein [Arthrobacter psychrochitiniphilus]
MYSTPGEVAVRLTVPKVGAEVVLEETDPFNRDCDFMSVIAALLPREV